MSKFVSAWNITKANAGGYANLQGDYGGETYRDIARNFNPTWIGWSYIDKYKQASGSIPNNATFPELDKLAGEFYKKKFWDPFLLDQIRSQNIANIIFDQTLDGQKRTALMIKRILGSSDPSGSVTPDLIKQINKKDPQNFFNKFKDLRIKRFRYAGSDLPESDPDFKFFAQFGKPPYYGYKYLKGWLNRVNKYVFDIADTIKKNPLKTLGIFLLAGAVIYFASKEKI